MWSDVTFLGRTCITSASESKINDSTGQNFSPCTTFYKETFKNNVYYLFAISLKVYTIWEFG